MTNEILETVISKLDGVQKSGSGFMARCPCREDDQNPSLAVGVGRDGRVLLNCHRGVCNVEQICNAIGMTVKDLHPHKPEKQKLKLTDTWDYKDSYGNSVFQKLRFVDETGRKTFRQRRPDGNGGWVYNLDGVPKILYRLKEVEDAIKSGNDVWVVEGEKDADTVAKTGRCATTMPGGAGKWLPQYSDLLSNCKRVIVVADNDEVGINHAKDVVDSLECKTLLLHSPVGKDVTDLINAGHKITDLVPLEEPEPDPFDGIIEKVVEISRRDLPFDQKVTRVRHIVDLADAGDVKRNGRLVTWDNFVGETTDDSYDWLIPKIMERQERVIVVAPEGVGKSMLARQISLCTAAGVHPFTLSTMPKIKTLYVDLENPERIIRRTSRRIVSAVHQHTASKDPVEAHLFSKPDGFNLLSAADRAHFEEVVEAVEPELICMGPLYKSFIDPGGRTSESVVIELATYLDSIRETYGAGLWLEHHAPLGSGGGRDLRPFGSAVWSRWPEFGITLEQDLTAPGEYVVGAFRGARDERAWPTRMRRGTLFPFDVMEW
jgi:hypothetical protein